METFLTRKGKYLMAFSEGEVTYKELERLLNKSCTHNNVNVDTDLNDYYVTCLDCGESL